jgi:hypothetical protein
VNLEIGSGVRNPALRLPGNPDPIHAGVYLPLGPVDGKGGANISGPYDPVIGWPDDMHPGEWKYGSGRGVLVDGPDRIITAYGGEVPAYDQSAVWGVDTFRDLRFTEINARKLGTHRHCHEIVIFDRAGHRLEDWDHWLDAIHENDVRAGKKPKSGHVNRIRIDPADPERHVWIVGLGNNGVLKFSNDGKRLVMKIDADSIPTELHPFVYAQDIAFLPGGEFIIGHLHHLMRFAADGTFLSAIGGQGRGPLEFDGLHDIQVHPTTGDLYVNDRVNERIQVLDQEGTFKDEWRGIQGVYAIRITADGGHLWAGNGFVQKFLKYDMTGRLVPAATWGTFGIAPGAIWGPHGFDTDEDGNLYVAEDYSGRIQKFTPSEGIDPADPQLIGPLAP